MEHNNSSDDEEGWEDLPSVAELMDESCFHPPPTVEPVVVSRTNTAPTKATAQPTIVSSSSSQRSSTKKKTILSHPLEHIGVKFLLELARQLYENDWTFRFSMMLLGISFVSRMILYSCYIYLYPRQVLYGGLIFAMLLILLLAYNHTNLGIAWQKISRHDTSLELLEESLSSHQVRSLVLGISYVLPTVLTIRTYQFLVELTSGSRLAVTTFCAVFGYYYHHHHHTTSTEFPTYILYGCALLSLPAQEWRHLPSIASHFCLASSILLYQRSEGNLSDILQRTLRCTIRSILSDARTTVEQDDLLKLTMLRWLAEYWAKSSNHQSSGSTSCTNETDHTTTTEESHEMEWPELSTMLQQTTTQMTQEAADLQKPTASTQREPKEARQADARPNRANDALPNEFATSIEGLQAMLTSMNLDDDAKPAVQSYKRMVAATPPKRSTAVFLGLTHRTPATILVVLYCSLAVTGLYHPPTITVYPLLLPFVIIELLYVQQWIEACRKAADTKAPDLPMDAMVFLLVDRTHVCSLLNVWENVKASVSALETGLVAARCVQTTALAADFCANMLSLANLGIEVSQHGWMHGLGVVVRELIHLHQTATPIEHLTHGMATPPGASYTSAAVSAVRNSQRMGRNIQVLAQEHGTLQAFAPIAGAVPVLVGQGWLWDNNRRTLEQIERRQLDSASNRIVEIEEETTESAKNSEPERRCYSPNVVVASKSQAEIANVDEVDTHFAGGSNERNVSVGKELSDEAPQIVDAALQPQGTPTVQPSENDNSSNGSFEPISDSEIEEIQLENHATLSSEETTSSGDQKREENALSTSQNQSESALSNLNLVDGQDDELNVEKPGEDNIWIKVGAGGLAIVGAVAALAATHHRISEGNKRSDRKQTTT